MSAVFRLSNSPYFLFGLFLICVFIAVVTYAQTSLELASLWMKFDESLGHGFLVALTSLYLSYQALVVRRSIPASPNWYIILPLFITSLLIALSGLVGVEIIQYLLLPVIILLSFTLIAGPRHAKHILIPLGLIYFAIPIWDYFNGELLALTTVIVQYLVKLSGITAYITGNSIFIPSGQITIAHGCSGLRYFIIGSFLGVISSYLNFISLKRAALLIFMVITLSLLANWVRVYGITMIAYITEMQSPLVGDHELLGWIIFIIFMIPLFYLNYRTSVVVNSTIKTDSQRRQGERTLFHKGNTRMVTLMVSLAILITSIATPKLLIGHTGESSEFTIDLSQFESPVIDDLPVVSYTPNRLDWQPQIGRPVIFSINQYGEDTDAIVVYRYLYVQQGGQGDIIPYTDNIYGRDLWTVNRSTKINGYIMQELSSKARQDQILIMYRFDVGGNITSSYLNAKLYQYPAVLFGKPYALFTAIYIPCQGDCESRRALLADLIE